MKIHIIGGSGSGKTFLANRFASKYHIAHYDLDDLFWDNNAKHYGIKMPLEKRSEKLKAILQQENWIIEGVYYEWVIECFQAADIIYVLEAPVKICKRRIILRFIKRKLGIVQGKRETCSSLLALLKWYDKYQRESIPGIKRILDAYKEKVVYMDDKQEIHME